MTLEIRLVSFNKPNIHQLTFTLDIRVIIDLLKCGCIRFQKATKCYSINFLLRRPHSMIFKPKSKNLNTIHVTGNITEESNTWIVSLSANCLCRMIDVLKIGKTTATLWHMNVENVSKTNNLK